MTYNFSFGNSDVPMGVLKQRAFNLRWAEHAEDVIPLTAADPDFRSAPEITEEISKYLAERVNAYGPPRGLLDFREAMSAYYNNKRNLQVNPEFILPVDSAAQGIMITCKALLNKGDEAIIFDPVDFLFKYCIEACGARAVNFPITDLATIDFAELENYIGPRTRIICLCNPLNPTGKVFSEKELKILAEIALKYQLVILSDEIWSDIVYKEKKFISIASLHEEIKNQTVTIFGFSKSYALAGFRIGTITCSNKIIFEKIYNASAYDSTVYGAHPISQIAAKAALEKAEYWLNNFITHLDEMRNLTAKTINSLPGLHMYLPEGCYVAWIDINKTGKNEEEFVKFILNEAKVALVPGSARWFGKGGRNHVRLCYSTSSEILNEALVRIKNAMA